MKIRPYEEQDYQDILNIYACSKLDELINESAQFELIPLDQDAKRHTELMESNICVYVDGSQILGYGAFLNAEIRALFVRPAARGKGIAKQLLMHMLSQIHGPAILYVAKTNELAKSLYTKFGFITVNEFETEYSGIPVMANKMECLDHQ